ncbi:high-affinity zinc uptake system binding-protein ZnuA precursor [Anaerotignum neopropionicum]|uniref:High-affinity zinc uptake system binding-protein ZnuA n=1 Tax=Anaerotignum neopropionicum TaxID=36847 RepID=A0A136WEP6_9FIRM|nr:zinc ABC transporter substrate-binding protein [Anaerotignum neopropionicum]KXL52996.1 high-affinity zinc uptake system binding-protein ZnuA precursor [Anaerotignum neopropionicum]
MKKIGLFSILVLIMVPFMLAGCTDKEENTEAKTTQKPVLAVSIVPEETFVKAVCKDMADVVVLVPPGSSPENYEPTPKEMEQFSNAQLYFSIGVPTEEANIMPKAKEIEGMKIVSLQDAVSQVYSDREIAPGERDPHIWLSPKRAIVMVQVIAGEMAEIDPANKAQYEENAQAYIEQLEVLDGQIQTALEGVQNKKFIVFHPAFGYLADDYGLQMYALEDGGKEATPQRLREMIDLAKQENIKAIFYQAEISSAQAESFAEEIGGKTVQMAPLAADYIENLKKMAEVMSEVMQ